MPQKRERVGVVCCWADSRRQMTKSETERQGQNNRQKDRELDRRADRSRRVEGFGG